MEENSQSYNISDAHLERLHQIVEEIPSGVRAETLKEVLNITKSPELLYFINNNITSSVNKTLDKIWINLKIPEKLKSLKQLEESSPKEKAWRFETGVANINPVIVESLLRQKDELQKQITIKKEESESLKMHLETAVQQNRQIINYNKRKRM